MTTGSTERWLAVERLFEAALEQEPAQRAAWLRATCDDDALRAEVESLLEAHRATRFFLESPAEPIADAPPPVLRAGAQVGPWRLERILGRGGMGTVYEAIGGTPERRVAVKVVRAEDLCDPHRLRLFRRETESLARLDHPGIAALIDQGHAADGQRWFAMELVAGRTLSEHVRERRVPRAERLRLFLELCAAIEYAHQSDVVHRDLKPSNVFVVDGADGIAHVKVLDFGLARLEGSFAESATTEPGRILGTLAYMSPEQARGTPDAVGPQSDVYALGVLLYELLTGALPVETTGVLLPEAVRLVAEREPERPSTYDHALRGNLDTIVMRALEKEPRRRYPSVAALAEDVERHLSGRPILARPPSAIERFGRVVSRHRIVFGSAAVLCLVALAAAVVTGVLYARAASAERLATRRANDVLSLSAIQELAELVERAGALWPATPDRIPDYDAWLADARVLVEGRPADPSRSIEAHPGLREHEAKLAEIRARARPSATGAAEFAFDDAGDRWWHAQLVELVRDLRAFADEDTGLLSRGISAQHGWGVVRRAEFARGLEERSLTGAEARARWRAAIDAVAADPRFGGLALAPQLGLLPLGADPDSGLQEFAHLPTGEPARRGADGRLALDAACGLVLVLIPSGTFAMGAQRDDPDGENFDPRAKPDESPVHHVRLDPWFFSKYEMTQGQWLRFTGRNPSQYGPGPDQEWEPEWIAQGGAPDLLHPVDRLGLDECQLALGRLGLTLPTEAQWECAARGGTRTPWWTGATALSLQGAANLADGYGKSHGASQWAAWEAELDDGSTVHARVGSYRANPYGLHDVHGNVMEWCLDSFVSYTVPARDGDGVRGLGASGSHHHRGGGFNDLAVDARCSDRSIDSPGLRHDLLGLRPALRIAR